METKTAYAAGVQTPDWERIRAALREPFAPQYVQWKAQAISKDESRALAVCYIDARMVMGRLDAVAGLDGWSDEYEVLAQRDGYASVECALSILGSKPKRDAGDCAGPDAIKGAYSDAFKRAAVKWGIGRYLYAIPSKWVPYDPKHKKLLEVPELPLWARPAKKVVVDEEPIAEPEAAAEVVEVVEGEPEPQPGQAAVSPPHWIDDAQTRVNFWVWTRSLGLSNDDVHRILGVKSMRDFDGTKTEAATLIKAAADSR